MFYPAGCSAYKKARRRSEVQGFNAEQRGSTPVECVDGAAKL